jgi:hypothetical protein
MFQAMWTALCQILKTENRRPARCRSTVVLGVESMDERLTPAGGLISSARGELGLMAKEAEVRGEAGHHRVAEPGDDRSLARKEVEIEVHRHRQRRRHRHRRNNGAQAVQAKRVELGDDRGQHVEPGDDRGRGGEVEAGDDRGRG